MPIVLIYGLLLAFLTALLWSAIGILYMRAVKEKNALLPFFAISLSLGAVLSFALVRWPSSNPNIFENMGLLILIMGVGGILNSVGIFLIARGMKTGHNAASWTIGQSSILIPAMFAIFYWKEHFFTVQWAGLILMVDGIFLLASPHGTLSQRDSGMADKWLVNAVGSFVVLGLGQILYLIPFHWENFRDTADLRVPVGMGVLAIMYLVLIVISHERIEKSHFKKAIPLAICQVCGQYTFFASADILAQSGLSSITFPIGIGGSIFCISMYAFFVNKELFTPSKWWGSTLAGIGIVLLSLSQGNARQKNVPAHMTAERYYLSK